jgi:ADP-ribose pyrophosphatase YjhB (NUDIX family)
MSDALWRIALRCAYRVLRAWWWLRGPEVHGAYVAVWQDDLLLLIRNTYRRGETVPCGAIGGRESVRAAAARELAEEVGIVVPESELTFVCELVVDFENKVDHAHFFELRVEAGIPIRIDHREVAWASFVPAAELADRPLVPHVRRYLDQRRAGPSQSA